MYRFSFCFEFHDFSIHCNRLHVVICFVCKLILIVILYPILETNIMASRTGRPPDAVLCAFCCISIVISISSCSPSFVKSEISSTSNELLKLTDYVSSDHQDCFHLKYLQFQRGIPISATFKNEKSDEKSWTWT